ncbi:hypothetical protein [Agrobacterium larrymoorei]|uniref:Uncharacterized protein n=1 Tax=Agrobacterium larrymoorei TaxID=160699 RepID=A0ABU0UF94_9HYPH|nr:hypothetical protein [Agrobacterium larrymoorei]MDQ1183577.1 hypothetical protein [Agrobacterium larrymoorei]
MAHVRFTESFDYRIPGAAGAATTAYPAGWVGTVKRDCANKAIAAKKAVAVNPPRGSAAEVESDG